MDSAVGFVYCYLYSFCTSIKFEMAEQKDGIDDVPDADLKVNYFIEFLLCF